MLLNRLSLSVNCCDIRQSYIHSHASSLSAVHKFTLAGCFKILICSVLSLLSIMWPFNML